MAERVFGDRRAAGRMLAGRLRPYRGRPDAVVVAVGSGGVPVAYEVAQNLRAPLDVLAVRTLAAPGDPRTVIGAIARAEALELDDDAVRSLGITPHAILELAGREDRELRHEERTYREGRDPVALTDRTVILVGDGLTGDAGILAAVRALEQRAPARIVVALAAATGSVRRRLADFVDEVVVCASAASATPAAGQSRVDFPPAGEAEARELLRAAYASRRTSPEGRRPSPADIVRSEAIPVQDGKPDDAVLFDLVGGARFVLIGEASHGTREFYAARAAITRRLIEERGFCAVAVEADWPDAYRVNRYVRGQGEDSTAEEALRGFGRFPAWMWRNTEVLDFVAWLRGYNDRAGGEPPAKVGFYGLDLYSLYRSAEEVIGYLRRVDPAAADRARQRYACFDRYGAEGQDYGLAAVSGAGEPCEREALEQLAELRRDAVEYARRDGLAAEDDLFYAQQNARTVQGAERYYRAMFDAGPVSWNLRDRHMVDTLEALAGHLGRQGGEDARVVVWAHNSHLGDARATEFAERGELNVGQLVRERYGDDCRLIGFTTYGGTVTAASDWGGPAERKVVRPGLPGSVEGLFHDTGQAASMLRFDAAPDSVEMLRSALLHRAIGVVYQPRTERQSHYLRARVADQYDAVIHVETTTAVEPLERTALWEQAEAPETFPYAV
jgi:erythromycin esterase-like protein/predicted phosphoribosyltransferase